MIRCKHWDRGECGAEQCRQHRGRTCERYEPSRNYGAFGWTVTVEFRDFTTREFHWCGCRETDAKRKGMLKSCARRIVACEPVTQEQWFRAYGDPDLKEGV